MAATKIYVSLNSVFAAKRAMTAKSDWQIDAKVTRVSCNKQAAIGDPTKKIEFTPGGTVNLDMADWGIDLDVTPADTQIKINVSVKDTKGKTPVDLGKVEMIVNAPITHRYWHYLGSDKDRFGATIIIDVLETTPGFSGPPTTILQNSSATTHSTLHEEMTDKMVHIHPVVPVPWSSVPPAAKGVQAMDATDQTYFGIAADIVAPNALANPSVIPVLDPHDSEFNSRRAFIGYTQIRPKNLDLAKLIWRSTSDSIKFWDGSAKTEITGVGKVFAYGVLAGDADVEGKIEVRWDGPGKPLLATYRAWVGKPKYVWCRWTIVSCSKTKIGKVPLLNPTVTAAQIKAKVAYSNVLLWQLGIQLVFDTDKTAYNGAVYVEDGIFTLTSSENYTFNVPNDDKAIASILNSRAGVFNIGFLHSVADSPNLLGVATDRRLSAAKDATATSSGSPSTSWVRPSGVFPDDDGVTITMKTMGASALRDPKQKALCGDGAIDKVCACLLTEFSKDYPSDFTVAHELCHVLGLHHRGNGGQQTYDSYDGVNHKSGAYNGRGHPWNENVMTYGPGWLTQDFDILQASVVRTHPLLKAAPPPPPPPLPPTPAPAPAATPAPPAPAPATPAPAAAPAAQAPPTPAPAPTK